MNTIVTDSPPVTAFELADPSGVDEVEFQTIVVRVLKHLQPEWIIFPFHPNVHHNDAVWMPDLAVVDKNFAYWFIVEVETSKHHLEKHVIPQVTAFREGRYADNTAQILANELDVHKNQADTLLATIPRDVIVISNKRDEKWNHKLVALGVQHIVIETYRNKTTSQTIHKIEGDLLPAYRSLGFGSVRLTDNVIVTQAGQFWKEGSMDIYGPNGIAKWQCAITDKRVWLMKEQGLIEFQNNAIVQFLLRQDNTLIVRLPYS